MMSGELMGPMEEVPLKELGEAELESAWLTERGTRWRELIPETRGRILEGTICYS